MIAEIIETHLDMITEFVERREPVPPALIRNAKRAANLVEEEVPEEKLKCFLAALGKVPVK